MQLKNKKCGIILFYKPTCPYCKEMKETWIKLGETAAFFNVYSFNCTKYMNHMNKIGEDMPNLVTSYPTMIVYKLGEPKEQYEGDRSLKDLLNTTMRACKG